MYFVLDYEQIHWYKNHRQGRFFSIAGHFTLLALLAARNALLDGRPMTAVGIDASGQVFPKPPFNQSVTANIETIRDYCQGLEERVLSIVYSTEAPAREGVSHGR